MAARSIQGALGSAREAARVSAAYRELLAEAGVDIDRVNTAEDFRRLPVLTKDNTFGRFSVEALSRPAKARDFGDVLTSSGRGGDTFGFRITTHEQLARASLSVDLGLQEAFDVDAYPTLLVNCLPMGVVLQSRAVTVANVSVREDMACAILQGLGAHFEQTLLCTDPLFVRQILNRAQAVGIDWARLNTSVVIGEEMLAEAQRDYIADRMGIDPDSSRGRAIISSFGVGELGLNLLVETRDTVRLRRAMRQNPDVANVLGGVAGDGSWPAVMCYSPLRCFVEVLDPDADGFGELCFTLLDRRATIPLPRYVTGDVGRVVAADEVRLAAGLAQTPVPWLPIVILRGRVKDRGEVGPSVEAVKEFVYADFQLADQLTGAFVLRRDGAGACALTVQARPGVPQASLAGLAGRLDRIARAHGADLRRIDIVSMADFSVRPVLDFERKFPYVASR
jgi:phenylacetate-CoA ligase